MKHLAKRVLSVLLATAMILGLLPAVALAYTALPSDKTEVGDGTVYFVGYEWNRENGRFGHASSGPEDLFDRNGSTKVCTGFDDYYEVEFSYNEPIVPNAYYFRTGGDTSFFPRRNPSAWTLSGRDENGDWIELDRQYNAQYTTENDTAVKFQIYNTRQYQQFKLTITDINQDGRDNWPVAGYINTFQLSEFYMSGTYDGELLPHDPEPLPDPNPDEPDPAPGTIYDNRVMAMDLKKGDILAPGLRHLPGIEQYTVVLRGGRYGEEWGGQRSESITLGNDVDFDGHRGTPYFLDFSNNFNRYYPYLNGQMTELWMVLNVNHSARTIVFGGYVEVQSDERFLADVSYRRYDSNGTLLPNGALPSGEGILVQSGTKKWTDGNTYVVSGSVTVDKRVEVSGSVNLILLDGATLTATKGISVNGGNGWDPWESSAETGTLNIYAGSTSGSIAGTGALIADARGSNDENAGLGGDSYTTGGELNIHGGVITAYGKTCAAGIGGGNDSSHLPITIYDGTVNATGGDNTMWGGAGIGGGFGADGGVLKVYGGTVNANGTGTSAGIGGGGCTSVPGKGGTVYIYGGTVNAYGSGRGAGIGGGGSSNRDGAAGGEVYIYGGTVRAVGGSDGAIPKGIGGGNSNNDHGSLTLGRGVTLYTSTNDTAWTDTTDDTSVRTRYMKTDYVEPPPAHEHNGLSFTPWESGDSLPDTPGNWYLTGNVTLANVWDTPAGEINLCLNGFGITTNRPTYGVMRVTSGSTLNLFDDGTAEHKYSIGTFQRPVVNDTTGTESFTGGYITGGGNYNNYNFGGGVMVNGTFNMYGGNILDNSLAMGTGGGVMIRDGVFGMYGGRIFGNSTYNAYLDSGTIRMGGNPDISWDQTIYGARMDLYLRKGQTIEITEPLGSGARVGITMQEPGVFTSGAGFASDEEAQAVFFSDNPQYFVSRTADGEATLSRVYTVVWQDWDGTVLEIDTDLELGVLPTYDGEAPTREGCVFIGWSPEPAPVSDDVTYIAIYNQNVASVTKDDSTTSYTTFSEALAAWDGGTLTLLEDVTTASTISVSKTGTLDLNGHGILMTGNDRVFSLGNGANLTIDDSHANVEHHVTLNNSSRATAVSDIGTESEDCIKITGGYIAGGYTTNSQGGAGLYLSGNAQVTLNGGNIVGNYTKGSGGGISCQNSSSFSMTGGVIRNNYAGDCGGALQGNNGSGRNLITGGTIMNNSASYGGGMNGILIELQGPAAGVGSANSPRAAGEPLVIKNNVATQNGGAVRGNVKLSGNVVFENNSAPAGMGQDIYLASSGDRINLTGPVGVSAPINVAYVNGAGTLTTGYDTYMNGVEPDEVLHSDNSKYTVNRNAAGELLLATMFTITWNNEDGTTLGTSTVRNGDTPVYSGATPTKAAEGTTLYYFTGWTPEIVPATGNATYTAVFESGDYVLYYTLNSAEDEDGDRYMGYQVGQTVEAQIWLESGKNIELQAFDIFVKSDAALSRSGFASDNAKLVTEGAGKSTDTITRFIAIGDEDASGTQKVQISMTAGEPVLLGMVSYSIDENVPYGQQLPITILTASNVAVEETPEGFTPAIGGYEQGAEINQTYTVHYEDNVADEEISVPQDQTKQHGIDLKLSYGSPVRPGLSFVGWALSPDATEADYGPGDSFSLNADTTLYAVWTQITHNVKWYNGEELLEEDTVLYGSVPSYDSARPTREPTVLKTYTFLGWNTDPNATSALPALPVVKDDVIFYAIFEEIARLYTVTWKSQDGSVVYGTSQHPYGELPVYPAELPEPYKSEDAEYWYTFEGWNKLPDQESAGTLENVVGDATYYAAFSKLSKSFQLILQGNGGTPDTTEVEIIFGAEPYVIPEGLVSREGYTFDGWNSKADGTGEPYFSVSNLTENLTLYAQWMPITYTLHYDGNGGVGTARDTTFTYEDSIVLLDKYTFTKPGSEFKMTGWNSKLDGTGTSILAGSTQTGEYLAKLGADENNVVTLYAQWTDKEYIIEYDLQGGVVNGFNPNGYTHSDTLEIAVPNVPTREGYTFEDWLVVSDESGAVTLTKHDGSYWIPAGTYGNLLFIAKWTVDAYELIFTVDGEASEPKQYTTESEDTLNDLFPAPVKDGFTFEGWEVIAAEGNWELGALKAPDFALKGSRGNATLEARWTVNSYTLTFKDGDETLASKLYNVGLNASLQMIFGSTPTRDGYEFAGWKYVAPDAGNWVQNTVYAETETVTGKFGDVTLYAQWTPLSYTIVFRHSTEVLGTAQYMVTTDRTLGELISFEIPQREGYTFAGWKYEDESFGNWLKDALYGNDESVLGKFGDVQLITDWEPVVYTISFYNENEELIDEEEFTMEDKDITEPSLDELQKPGYEVEWGEYDTNLPEDQIVHPVYTPKEYVITFDVDGGTAIEPMTYTIESEDKLPAAVKGLYAFKGWTVTVIDTEEGNWSIGTDYNADSPVKGKFGNVTLKANWSFEDNVKYAVEEYKYAPSGYVMLRIADTLDAAQAYSFNGTEMYVTTDPNYLFEDSDATDAFFTLIPVEYVNVSEFKLTAAGADMIGIADVADAGRTSIVYDGKINVGDSVVNIADANAVFQMLSQTNIGGYYSLSQLPVSNRLGADMVTETYNADHRGTIADVHAIVDIVRDNTAE